MCPLICFSCSCRARETNSIVHAWSHGGSQIRGPGESSDRSVLHPWLARNPAAAREVDTHVSSILTIDPYRRDSTSVSRLCHVHPEQGVDLECVTFEQGVPPFALLQGLLLGSRPVWAAHLRAAYAVPGLETGKEWPRGPLTHATSWPPCVRWGYQGENSRLSSRPSPSPSGAVLCTGQISLGRASMQVARFFPHRWASLASIDGGYHVRERRPARTEQERKVCDRCAVGSLLFGTCTVVCFFAHRERIVFLLDQA